MRFIREHNVALAKNERLQFDRDTSAAYEELLTFAPAKRPLWTKRNGFSARSREETHAAIFEIATTGNLLFALTMLLNLVFLYRFPLLCRQVRLAAPAV